MQKGATGILIAVIAIVVLAGGGFYAYQSGLLDLSYEKPQFPETSAQEETEQPAETETKTEKQVSSFEECTEAGYPVMESYPRKCRSPEGQTFTELIVANDTIKEAGEGTPVSGSSYTVEEFESKPTLCEKDSDCKIIAITCNKCDCGRAVNSWIEPYQCTDADKANSCNFVCPAEKAVCEAGVCKKKAA